MELEKLKKVIEEEVFVTKKEEKILGQEGMESAWLFDFRRVMLRSDVLACISNLFWERCGHEQSFQIGGIEVSSIPLIAGVVLKGKACGRSINGFFIRKSRKKDGLTRMLEGIVTEEKIILIDDLMKSGQSFMRQIEVIEGLGKKVYAVFVILRFRDLEYYTYLHEKGIRIISLFTLDDFATTLHTANLPEKKSLPIPRPFKINWCFASADPNFFHVVPKSAPTLNDGKVFFGSDNGTFWALDQHTGAIAWSYKIRFGSKGKFIFSSPAICEDLVYFGGYDGNFYALNKKTGVREWVFMDADWIGSSPCAAPDLHSIFVGLEFGLFTKRGALVALDAESGRKKWEFYVPGLIHSSPAYSKKYAVVIVGCNDCIVRAFHAEGGTLLWEYKTEGEVKASFAFDEASGTVAFGSFDGNLYVLAIKTGALVHKIKTREAIYSSPIIGGGKVFFTSLDKRVYGAELASGKILWEFATAGRVFATPQIIEGSVVVGSNDGRLYELDPLTGKNTAQLQVTERITNAVAYDAEAKTIFLPTFANEIYSIQKYA